jgi:hypothetical protein
VKFRGWCREIRASVWGVKAEGVETFCVKHRGEATWADSGILSGVGQILFGLDLKISPRESAAGHKEGKGTLPKIPFPFFMFTERRESTYWS